jgi:Spy/CpxP family protein refolding chaperone
MKTFTKAVVVSSLVAGGLAVAGTRLASASPDEHGDCRRGGHSRMMGGMGGEDRSFRHMTERLDLTDDQRTALRDVLKKSESPMRAAGDKLRTNREALRKLEDEGKADDKQVQKLAQEQGKLMADMIVQRAKVHGEMQKVLTDAQRQQLKEMRSGAGRPPRG